MLELVVSRSAGRERLLRKEASEAGASPEREPVRAGCESGRGRRWIEIDGVGRFRFTAGESRVQAHPLPGTGAETVRSAFLATVLPLALQASGHHLLHASAVETGRGVVAFCGRSGVGKSTLAYGLARRGFRQWSDDSLWFEVGRREIGTRLRARTRRLPWRPRLRPDVARRLSTSPAAAVAETSKEPPVMAPLVAIYHLARSPGDTRARTEPLRLAEAFPALLDNAYHFPGDDRSLAPIAAAYLDLATIVPVARLTLPDDLDRLDAGLNAVAERLAFPGARAHG